MIAFAACVADPDTFRAAAVPGLRQAAEPDSVVIEADADASISGAYNEVLEAARGFEGLEALVLLDEETAITDPAFCGKVRELLALPDVAVVGAVGARGVDGLAWWEAPERFGSVGTQRRTDGGDAEVHEVDTVDGVLMVLSPWAVEHLEFDAETFAGFEGHDADLCAQARAAGKRVLVGPLEVQHPVGAEDGARPSPDPQAFAQADRLWREKWRSGAAEATRPAPQAPVPSPAAAGLRTSAAPSDDAYFEWNRPELRALVPAGARRVLDVGCGAGAVGAALKAERGIEVVGLEGFPDAAARAEERLDAALCVDLDTLDGLPFDPGGFDAMIFGDVLEHLRDPHRLLRVLRPQLADDGVLVCSIPNVKHWSVLFPLLVNDRWEYQDAGLLDRTHVHFFTLEEIDRMLTASGFDGRHVGVNDIAPLPDELRGLVDVAVRYGADRAETAARLGAYQYLVVAGKAGTAG